MLDYFIQKGYVIIKPDGSIERTERCPKDIVFREDEDGIVKFYYDYITSLTPIQINYE